MWLVSQHAVEKTSVSGRTVAKRLVAASATNTDNSSAGTESKITLQTDTIHHYDTISEDDGKRYIGLAPLYSTKDEQATLPLC